mgnify:CR=1 FL=1
MINSLKPRPKQKTTADKNNETLPHRDTKNSPLARLNSGCTETLAVSLITRQLFAFLLAECTALATCYWAISTVIMITAATASDETGLQQAPSIIELSVFVPQNDQRLIC